MAEQITIPISIFEVTIRYEKPVIRLLTSDRTDVIQALFDAFAEYQPNADDLEVVGAGKTTEQGIKLRLASQRVNFFFGATSCKFTKEAAAWPEADKIFSRLVAFLTILTELGGICSAGEKVDIVAAFAAQDAATRLPSWKCSMWRRLLDERAPRSQRRISGAGCPGPYRQTFLEGPPAAGHKPTRYRSWRRFVRTKPGAPALGHRATQDVLRICKTNPSPVFSQSTVPYLAF
jgi:hypothetical protein